MAQPTITPGLTALDRAVISELVTDHAGAHVVAAVAAGDAAALAAAVREFTLTYLVPALPHVGTVVLECAADRAIGVDVTAAGALGDQQRVANRSARWETARRLEAQGLAALRAGDYQVALDLVGAAQLACTMRLDNHTWEGRRQQVLTAARMAGAFLAG